MVKDEFIVCPLVFYSWEVEFLLDHFVSFANDALHKAVIYRGCLSGC